MAKILADCRDIAIHRLITSFGGMLDRVGDMLMERASRTDVREDQVACLDARDALQQGKGGLLAEFERRLRTHIDDGISGKSAAKTEFAKLETDKLTLIDTHAMDESVVTGGAEVRRELAEAAGVAVGRVIGFDRLSALTD